MNKFPLISILTPAYNEAENVEIFYNDLSKIISINNYNYEWIIIDDHSNDETFNIIKSIAKDNPAIHGIRLTKNFGARKAIQAGLKSAKGDIVIIMAVDLQDPLELIPELITRWNNGSKIVWAVRKNDTSYDIINLFSKIYYLIINKIVGFKNLPLTGTDYYLIDRKVIKELHLFKESNINIVLLLMWMGFKQDWIYYKKKDRVYGQSGWTFRKKIDLVIDSITSFSSFPIRVMTYSGLIVSIIGFIYSVKIIYNVLFGMPVEGWSSIMVVTLVIGGLQLIMLGVLGEYIWRNLDESRRRPLYLIEETIGIEDSIQDDNINE